MICGNYLDAVRKTPSNATGRGGIGKGWVKARLVDSRRCCIGVVVFERRRCATAADTAARRGDQSPASGAAANADAA